MTPLDPLRYEHAACKGDPQGQAPWFPPKDIGSTSAARAELDLIAKSVCGTCRHIDDCREWALSRTRDGLHGTWGGLTQRELTLERRRRNNRNRRVG